MQGAQHRILDYITPMIAWLKEDVNSTKTTKENAKAKIETVAKIHSTLEKSVDKSKGGDEGAVMKNLSQEQQIPKKSAVFGGKAFGPGDKASMVKKADEAGKKKEKHGMEAGRE